MTDISLPTTAIPLDGLQWQVVGGGGILRPMVGGVEAFAGRMGDKMAVTGTLPTMDADCAAAWVAAALASRTQKLCVLWTLPAPYGLAGAGTPLVKGAGQTGSTLLVDGLTAGLVIPRRTPFNIQDSSGRVYLHFTTSEVTANGSGEATLAFGPMMRVSPADNSTVQLAAPKLRGWLNDGGVSWSEERLEFHSVPFAVREAR
jgi:hypothetical protein